jgi:hypothetical protein
MANKDAAFGLKPIGKVGQNRDNQGLSEYSIKANDSTTIYFQDPVKASADGTIDQGAAGGNILGSLNGVFYTDPTTKKPTWRNHYEQVNASDIVAFVADDPYERFEIQSNNTAASAQTDVFNNADIELTAGNSANYVSKAELNDSTLSTNSAQLKVIGVSKDPDNNELGAANANVVVIISEHQLKENTGY